MANQKINNHTVPNFLTTFFLGSARIASSSALNNLGIRGALSDIGVDQKWFLIISVYAAASNAANSFFTRFPSIYRDNFPAKIGYFCSSSDHHSPESEATLVDSVDGVDGVNRFDHPGIGCFSRFLMRAAYASILGCGIVDFAFTVLNSFNAVLQIQCYWGNHEEYCQDGFKWHEGIWYVPYAAFSLFSGAAFMSFVVQRVDANALTLIQGIRTMSLHSIQKRLNPSFFFILLPTAVLQSISSAAVMFYSTSQMLETVFGITPLSQHDTAKTIVYNGVVYTAILSSITTLLFARVPEAYSLIQGEKKFKKKLKEWFLNCDKEMILVKSVVPLLLSDLVFTGLMTYPGTIGLLQQAGLENPWALFALAMANVVSSSFLYFAFNTQNALENAARIQRSFAGHSVEYVDESAQPDQPKKEKAVQFSSILSQKKLPVALWIPQDDEDFGSTGDYFGSSIEKTSGVILHRNAHRKPLLGGSTEEKEDSKKAASKRFSFFRCCTQGESDDVENEEVPPARPCVIL